MCTEKEYKRMENEILTMINNANYPSGHPFVNVKYKCRKTLI